MKNYLIFIVIFLTTTSCTSSRKPHEIKSPCVSNDQNLSSPYSINPCNTRPMNIYYEVV